MGTLLECCSEFGGWFIQTPGSLERRFSVCPPVWYAVLSLRDTPRLPDTLPVYFSPGRLLQ